MYKLGIKFGIYILPAHYGISFPNIIELERRKKFWAKKSELPGILVNMDQQLTNIKNICMPYQNEYTGNKFYHEAVLNHLGPGFGDIEAQTLHAVIRTFKPKQIIEIGSGISTYCMIKACELNDRETLQNTMLTSIDPFPFREIRNMSKIKLISQEVQTVPLELFLRLDKGDFLFIDSTHTVKVGSDVNYLILEVLPRLKSGVIIHFHDIFFPYDYQRDILQTFFYWNETSLLRAFLIFNQRARIIFSLSQLHYECRVALKEIFRDYTPQEEFNGLLLNKYKPFEPIAEHFPSSIYIEIL
ncbi:MAG: hypothetical protein A3I11_04205 [Elusimicrobia bacterium RIFCSPLOWO2_02_FULL_39_32]|nr:MAG: hypothetical protein A2034_06540 [Elusimicrobia bacterium GWA2_38_7]OGR92902.1 MAG: hypothetical protein A3I11_04205 [Elusimicrobia bacterium RIFCSPLOWO2_02_FULL_39_32]OGR99686.1 MAG: hypothetical protein A3G85_01570 [Elusimicrobia bacterium RIFCSPLOWO2_12_FULL_39_28]